MKVLALIPARGGSVRFPAKNMKPLCGVPLIGWTIREACKAFGSESARIIVSTDDGATKGLCDTAGVEWIHRPNEIAQGKTNPIKNVEHAVKTVRDHGWRPDAVCYLQPTSPLRTSEDILGAMNLFAKNGADAVVSITEGRDPWVYEVGHADRLHHVGKSQSFKRLGSPNGAVYVMSIQSLDKGYDWDTAISNGITYAFWMPKSRSIDIDVQSDFDAAEALMRQRMDTVT